MKAKRIRRQFRKVLRDNVRLVWVKLCALPRRERWRLAWMLIRSDADLDRAAKKGSKP